MSIVKDQWITSSVTSDGNVIGVYVYDDSMSLAVVNTESDLAAPNDFKFLIQDIETVIETLKNAKILFERIPEEAAE